MQVHSNLSYGPHGERNLLDLYLPEEGGTFPLVVVIHGGGWANGEKRSLAWEALALADHGFAAAAVNYRLCPEWVFPAQVEDVRRAVRWLRRRARRFGLAPERFGAIGSSAGGHLSAFLGLTEASETETDLAGYPSRVQCVVDCYGPVDLVAMMESASAPIVEGLMACPLPGHEAAYREASPAAKIGNDACPFLICHGTLDVGESRGQVPIRISRRFHQDLRKAGADSTLLELEGAGHGFSSGPANPHSIAMWAAALPFFERHLRT